MDLFAKVSSALGFGDPRNSEELAIARNIVLERLKKNIQKIVQDSRYNDGEHLDETKESVHELVWTLETCLFQGIIPLNGTDDKDNVYSLNYNSDHFWSLVELLYDRGSMAFGASIDMVKYCMNVKTEYGRCRAWIRQLLNQHALAFNLKVMFEDQATVRKTYFLESLVENRDSLDTFLSLLASLNTIGFELKVDRTDLDTSRDTNIQDFCLISGAGVPEVNGLYEKQTVLKDNVGMYLKGGYEIFRTEYRPPALPNDATPQVTKRWFLGNPDKRVVYYFSPSSATLPQLTGWQVHPSAGIGPAPTLGRTFLEAEKPPPMNSPSSTNTAVSGLPIASTTATVTTANNINANIVQVTNNSNYSNNNVISIDSRNNDLNITRDEKHKDNNNDIIIDNVNNHSTSPSTAKTFTPNNNNTGAKNDTIIDNQNSNANVGDNFSISNNKTTSWDNMSLALPESIVVVKNKPKRKKDKKEKKKKKKKSKNRSSKKVALIDDEKNIDDEKDIMGVEKEVDVEAEAQKKKKSISPPSDMLDKKEELRSDFKGFETTLNTSPITTLKKSMEDFDDQIGINPIELNIEKIEIEEEFDESLDVIDRENSLINHTQEYENEETIPSNKNQTIYEIDTISNINYSINTQHKSSPEEEVGTVATTEIEERDVDYIEKKSDKINSNDANVLSGEVQTSTSFKSDPVLRMDTYSDEDLEGLANEIYVGDIEYHTGHDSSDVSPLHSPIHSAKSNVSSRSNSYNNEKDFADNNLPGATLSTIIDDSPRRSMKVESSPQPEFVEEYSNGNLPPEELLNITTGENQHELNCRILKSHNDNLNKYRDERKQLRNDLQAVRQRQHVRMLKFEQLKRNSIINLPGNNAPRVRSESYTRDDFTRSPIDWSSKDDVSILIDGNDAKDIRKTNIYDRKHSLHLLDPEFPGGDELIQLDNSSLRNTVTPPHGTGSLNDSRYFNNSSPYSDSGKHSSGILAIDADVYEFRVFLKPKPHVKYLIRVSERVTCKSNTNLGNDEDINDKHSSSDSDQTASSGKRYYDIQRRYNQFKTLHNEIVKIRGTNRGLPKLPKSAFVRSFDPFYLQNKALALNEYLKLLVEIFRLENVTERTPLVSFLAARDEDMLDEDIAKSDHGNGSNVMSNNKSINVEPRKNKHGIGWSGFHVPLVLAERPPPGKMVDSRVGIGLQRYRCGSCGDLLTKKNGFRYCQYSELYHCKQCSSTNSLRVLPTRVLHSWDFKKYPVCDQVETYLENIDEQPLFCVSAINPQLFAKIKPIQHVRMLRIQLMRMVDFLDTCRQGLELRTRINERGRHLMEGSEMYSMKDFREIKSKHLQRFLMREVQRLAEHIKFKCVTCSARGFVCEICSDDRPIYAFEILKASACTGCKAFFHRQCIEEALECPRCKRLRRRRDKNKLMMPKNILDVDNTSSNLKERFDNTATHYESSLVMHKRRGDQQFKSLGDNSKKTLFKQHNYNVGRQYDKKSINYNDNKGGGFNNANNNWNDSKKRSGRGSKDLSWGANQ